MGLLWGRKKNAAPTPTPAPPAPASDPNPADPPVSADVDAAASSAVSSSSDGVAAGLLAAETSVFEFGSAGREKVTLAGYCPVSDALEPCRWKILPSGDGAPKFRVIF
ncbi:hypothetical protein SELMODRAFT_89724 [Selaginella moellendorffii]|uniref:Uncharacterized protein n=1 Tax=Selaginella moellendorffii TaxID=88036 RepID=D8RAZ6_SELML|nr:uncharacterized protein LOC9650117 [Selaginella moellendorffii]EFJ30401.1 hypothetical protein SELMODRAFT_89724 [Selaginella moellendorffii]|eukprot:XP_002968147.1 uncharacterized protein LOC9650117 [Selaginella moellendorffii]